MHVPFPNILVWRPCLYQVASGCSSFSVTISRCTVDGIDPTPKLFIILYYYEIVSSVLYMDMNLNKHAYIPGAWGLCYVEDNALSLEPTSAITLGDNRVM